MKCSQCGAEITGTTRYCSECGHPTAAFKDAAAPGETSDNLLTVGEKGRHADIVYPKNPPLSPHICWANLALPGLAQMIHGQVAKGIVILAAQLVTVFMLPVLGLLVAVASLIDAYKVGKALKLGKTLGKWEFFPNA